MLDPDGFGNDRTDAIRPCEPGQRDEQMNQKEDDFAHLWIAAKRGQKDQFWLNLAIRHLHLFPTRKMKMEELKPVNTQKKPPCGRLIYECLVAGVGFEPTTFGL